MKQRFKEIVSPDAVDELITKDGFITEFILKAVVWKSTCIRGDKKRIVTDDGVFISNIVNNNTNFLRVLITF